MITGLCVAGFLLLLSGTWIYLKAALAKILLASAWEQTVSGSNEVKPWPWADTFPVARLYVPRLNVDEIVLSGANGPTLAFGPGHVMHTERPGGEGNCVIVGHRDTNFRFLKSIKKGDDIVIRDRGGIDFHYTVSRMEIVDKNDVWVTSQCFKDSLTLITCYPFDDILPGPGRYVVWAKETR